MESEALNLIQALETLAQTLRDDVANVKLLRDPKSEGCEPPKSREERAKLSPEQRKADKERRWAEALKRRDEDTARRIEHDERNDVREMAYFDAFDALMALHAQAAVRTNAQRLATLLRETKMLELEKSRLTRPSRKNKTEKVNLSGSKEEQSEALRKVFEVSRKAFEHRIQRETELLHAQIALLDQALDLARTLA